MEWGFWHVTCAILVPGILLASWVDYSQRRVPNWLNLALIITGFVAQGWFYGSVGLTTALWGMLVGFGLLIVPWLMHGMGAGDVKLLAAIGVWMGPKLTLYSFVLGALLGGICAVILTKCTTRHALFSEFGSVQSFGASTQLLPYGVPLSAGTLLVLAARLFGWWGI